MTSLNIDTPTEVRHGEELDLLRLNDFIQSQLSDFEAITEISQFSGGYSNLTYFLKTANKEYVLRRPPFGAKDIKGGHDMGREYKILSAVRASGYNKIPNPVIFSDVKNE